jgi:DNA-directed RNA polymerase alpha subunit
MLKICSKGHQYYKSSDCPTCPKCEQAQKPVDGLLSLISAPARRALERKNIYSVQELAAFTENEILELHGVGPTTIPKLKLALNEAGLSFRKP